MATHGEEKHSLVLLIHEQGARAEDEPSPTGFTNFSSVRKLMEMQRRSRSHLEDPLGSTKIPGEGRQHLQGQEGTGGEGRISRVPPEQAGYPCWRLSATVSQCRTNEEGVWKRLSKQKAQLTPQHLHPQRLGRLSDGERTPSFLSTSLPVPAELQTRRVCRHDKEQGNYKQHVSV